MKTILTLIFLSLPTFGWTCSCMILTKKEARKIMKHADYVIVGIAIENVHHNDSVRAELNSRNFGIEVKFKVEQIIKGDLKSNYVYINQFESGNCIQRFEFGKKYVIVGTRIKEFVNRRPFSEKVYKGNEIFETVPSPPPPPIVGMTINGMNCYNIEKELVDYWNRIVQIDTVLYTNQCSSFYTESTFGRYFIK